jgi:hypothetical protein
LGFTDFTFNEVSDKQINKGSWLRRRNQCDSSNFC